MGVKLGVCEWILPVKGLHNRVALAASMGLRGVALDFGSEKDGYLLSEPPIIDQFRLLKDQHHVSFPALALNELNQLSLSNIEHEELAQLLIGYALETAAALDIPILQLPSFGVGEVKSDADLDLLTALLINACHQAEQYGVLIGTENTLSSKQQRSLLAMINHELLQVYFDTRNPFSMKGYDSAEMLRELLPHVCQVHIKDGYDNGGALLLGEGNSGAEACSQALKDLYYDGWVLLENDYVGMAETYRTEAEHLLLNDITNFRNFMI